MRVGKDMAPDGFDGKCRANFRNWVFKMEAYLVDQTYRAALSIMKWAPDQKGTITESDYIKTATERDWTGSTGRDHIRFARYLYNLLTIKTTDSAFTIVRNGERGNGIDAWRRLMEEYDPKLISGAAQYLKIALGIPRAKSLAEASSTLQRLEEAVRKYEELGSKQFDSDVKLQRLFDIMPLDLEKHIILESRGEIVPYDEVRRRAMAWIQANMGPAPMDLSHLRSNLEKYQWWATPDYDEKQKWLD